MLFLFSTNYKHQGNMFLVYAAILFILGLAGAVFMQTEIFKPDFQFMHHQVYGVLRELHIVIMVLAVLYTSVIGLITRILPQQLNCNMLYFKKMHTFSFWLFVIPLIVELTAIIFHYSGHPINWTTKIYNTNTIYQTPVIVIFTLLLFNIGIVLTLFNFIVSIIINRPKNIRLLELSPFIWSVFLFSLITILLATTYCINTISDVYSLLTSQTITEISSRPVPIEPWFRNSYLTTPLIVFSLGLSASIFISNDERKYRYASILIIFLVALFIISSWVSLLGDFDLSNHRLSKLRFLISIFTGNPITMLTLLGSFFLLFAWRLQFSSDEINIEKLFAITAIIFLFLSASVVYNDLYSAALDYQYHDTYVVNHVIHYSLFGGILFSIYAGIYHWLPEWTGTKISSLLSYAHFALSIVFVFVTFLPHYYLGLKGMPLNIPDYSNIFADLMLISSYGAFGLVAAQILFFVAVFNNIAKRKIQVQKV